MTSPKYDFSDFNISEALKKGIHELGYLKPTEFQKEVFEHFNNGQNIIGEGQSSYGKSLAFSLPILAKISVDENEPQALIICENFALGDLAMKECRALGRHLKISVDNAVASDSWQEHAPQLIVCTAEDLERLKDILNEKTIHTIFFDGLSSDNTQKAIEILSPMLNKDIQIMIFGSETLSTFKSHSEEIIEKAAHVQNSDQPKVVVAAKHIVHQAKGDEPKPRALLAAIFLHNKKGVLVTCNEASEVELLARFLMRYGFKTISASEEQNRSAVADNLNILVSGKADVFICQNTLLNNQSLGAVPLMINFDMIERPQLYENITQFKSQAAGLQRTIVNLLSSRELSFLGPIKAQCLIDFSDMDLPSGEEVISLAANRIIALLNQEAESIELGQFESLATEITKSGNCVPALALLLRNHLLNQSVKSEPERAPRERMSERRPYERRDERAPRAPRHSHAREDAKPREESRPREENRTREESRVHEEPERKTASENILDGSTRLYVTLGRQDGFEDLASLAQYLSNNSGVDLGHFSGAGMLRDHSAHIEVDSDVADAIINAVHNSARPNSPAPAAEGEAATNNIVCERAKLNTERKYSRPPHRRGGYQRRR